MALTDVTLANPSDGDVMTWSAPSGGVEGRWKNKPPSGGGATTLAALTDVAVSAPADRQSLVYDLAMAKWVNGLAALTVEQLSDAAISGAASGDGLVWNGSSWTNIPLVIEGNLTINSLAAGQTIKWDGFTWVNTDFPNAGTGSTNAVAGAATLNTVAGVVHSEALVAQTSYTLTLTNSQIATTSIVLFNVYGLVGGPVDATIVSKIVNNGNVVLAVSFPSYTGQLYFDFAVHN